jgi:hypothetical protein
VRLGGLLSSAGVMGPRLKATSPSEKGTLSCMFVDEGLACNALYPGSIPGAASLL